MNKEDNIEWDAGSRMHVLDWVESSGFQSELQHMVDAAGFQVGTIWRPKGRDAHTESVLVGVEDRFLQPDQRKALQEWWIVHCRGSKFPTWDLVASAIGPGGKPALILVEAKAHSAELKPDGKAKAVRETKEQQQRTDENHARIAAAILEASQALASNLPSVALSADANYQFANRVAFSWKLASLGIPVVLIYLGFIGDDEIATKGRLMVDEDWRRAFVDHAALHFPEAHLNKPITTNCAPFWVVLRTLRVKRKSPPIAERRQLK